MRVLELTDDNKFRNRQFFVLGPEVSPSSPDVIDKIRGDTRKNVDEVWGTLGMADNSRIRFTGTLLISRRFNSRIRRSHVTGRESELIQNLYPSVKKGRIKERFINFDQVDFSAYDVSEPARLPVLRLTVMVEEGEGALVFYQHAGSDPRGDVVQYIQPQPTVGHTTRRDRLDYHFELLPNLKGISQRGKDGTPRYNFLVKILTFEREDESSWQALQRAQEGFIAGGGTWVKYDPRQNEFVEDRLDFSKKTLFLIHGTFSSTGGTFESLLEPTRQNPSWLEQVTTGPGGYQQVIGFDHRTIRDGVLENEEALLQALGPNAFDTPLDVVTSSRGGLLFKHLLRSETVKDKLPFRRVALSACSNGVEYFTLGARVPLFLSVLKYLLPGQASSLIALFAQHSASFFLKQPGARIQTPGSTELESLLSSVPAQEGVGCVAVVGDLEGDFKRRDKFFQRIFERGLDAVVSAMFNSKHHDLVVHTERQRILKPCEAASFLTTSQRPFDSVHTGYFDKGEVRDFIQRFLFSGSS